MLKNSTSHTVLNWNLNIAFFKLRRLYRCTSCDSKLCEATKVHFQELGEQERFDTLGSNWSTRMLQLLLIHYSIPYSCYHFVLPRDMFNTVAIVLQTLMMKKLINITLL